MRIVAISDTHLQHLRYSIKVPEGDLLIHSGDALNSGNAGDLAPFSSWFGGLPHKRKIFVAGNHDRVFEKNPTFARAGLPKGVIYLQDDQVEIDGFKIYGAPWQPEFLGWAFNLSRGGALREKWDKIPDGIDILITHGPPFGILDRTIEGEYVGCEELLEAVKRVKPKVHIFGHIHHGYGRKVVDGTLFVNAATCGEDYVPSHPPIVIDL